MGLSLSDFDPTKHIKKAGKEIERGTKKLASETKSLIKGIGHVFEPVFKEVKRFVKTDLFKGIVAAALIIWGGMTIYGSMQSSAATAAASAETAATVGSWEATLAATEGVGTGGFAIAPEAVTSGNAILGQTSAASVGMAPGADQGLVSSLQQLNGSEKIAQDTLTKSVSDGLASEQLAAKTAESVAAFEPGAGVDTTSTFKKAIKETARTPKEGWSTADKFMGTMAAGQIIQALAAPAVADPYEQQRKAEERSRGSRYAYGIRGNGEGTAHRGSAYVPKQTGLYSQLQQQAARGANS